MKILFPERLVGTSGQIDASPGVQADALGVQTVHMLKIHYVGCADFHKFLEGGQELVELCHGHVKDELCAVVQVQKLAFALGFQGDDRL